jgi:hypothetical protein
MIKIVIDFEKFYSFEDLPHFAHSLRTIGDK